MLDILWNIKVFGEGLPMQDPAEGCSLSVERFTADPA
jgi:hypothetical protein